MATVFAHHGARQLPRQEAAQTPLEAGAVEARRVVLEDAGQSSAAGDHAYRVAVADVRQHGVLDAVGQGPVERRRTGVGGEHRGAAGELGGEVGCRAQSGELARDRRVREEQVGQRTALRDCALPLSEAKDAV